MSTGLSGWKMTRITTGQWPENNAEIHQKKLDSGDIVVQSCLTRVWPDNVGHRKDLAWTANCDQTWQSESDHSSPLHGRTSFESIKSKKLSCRSDTFIRITLLSITLATNCVDRIWDQMWGWAKPHIWWSRTTVKTSAKTFLLLSSSHCTGITKLPFLRWASSSIW